MIWRLGVAGHPVGHSLSPVLHEAGLAQLGLTGSSRRVDARGVGELAAVLGSFDGLSITMPLKGVARALCDEVDDVVGRTGMVNSLALGGGRVRGANTDGRGLLDALDAHGWAPRGARVAVLGAGGAAWSIVEALVGAGARVAVSTRRPEALVALRALDAHIEALADGGAADLVVQTVPVGRRGGAPTVRPAGPHAIAVDITYEPRVSPWLAEHGARGWITMNGLPMLAYQAARQLTWWLGAPVDGAALARTLA